MCGNKQANKDNKKIGGGTWIMYKSLVLDRNTFAQLAGAVEYAVRPPQWVSWVWH